PSAAADGEQSTPLRRETTEGNGTEQGATPTMALRPRVEVADRSLVLRARRLVWPREGALAPLATRPGAGSRCRDCFPFPALPRLRPSLNRCNPQGSGSGCAPP